MHPSYFEELYFFVSLVKIPLLSKKCFIFLSGSMFVSEKSGLLVSTMFVCVIGEQQ